MHRTIVTSLKAELDHDFLSILSGDLKLAVSTSIQRVLSNNKKSRSDKVKCTTRAGNEVLDVCVEPLIGKDLDLGMLLVTFEPRESDTVEEDIDFNESEFKNSTEAHNRILMLEDELRSTKENLQATVEELQTSNEELQAINEEVQVSNEELQSTNEELHSMNEELYTVNSEMEQKNSQLIELNTTHENLMANTEDGILYVDEDLRIKKFNPAIKTAFHLLPQDIGRPIDHIVYNFDNREQMTHDVKFVIQSGNSIIDEGDNIHWKNFHAKSHTFY